LGDGELNHTHITIAINPTNAVAASAAKHRSTESKLKPSTSKALGLPAWANICSLPKHGVFFTPTMVRTIAMLGPSCFAKWDKRFYFLGQQLSRQ
jgi:hypothetical protein